MMKTVFRGGIEKLTWSQVAFDVTQVNPILADIINQLSPADALYFYKIRYPYGAPILKQSVLQVPDKYGDFLPVTHAKIPAPLRHDLGEVPLMPLGLVLTQGIEAYFQANDLMVPLSLHSAGQLTPLWVAPWEFPPTSKPRQWGTWQMTAGARFIFFLAKISNAGGYQRLRREFQLHTPMPEYFLEHWPLLVAIANSNEFPSPWFTDILFFSNAWEKLLLQPTGTVNPLAHYLYQHTRWGETSRRHLQLFNFAFSLALKQLRQRCDPYLVDTLKHMYVSQAAQPPPFHQCFSIANTDRVAPISQFEKIFTDCYQIAYAPTMVHTALGPSENFLTPNYYSLGVPTVLDYQLQLRKLNNKLHELRELRNVHVALQQFFEHHESQWFPEGVRALVTETDLQFFHQEPDPLNHIQSTEAVISLDSRLQAAKTQYPAQVLPTASAFLRGCVRLSPKPA